MFVCTSTNQKAIDIPEGMVIKKTPSSLLSLLESHAGWPPLKALVPPKPQTLITLRSSPVKPTEKKRKREKRPGKEVVEEGEI